MSTLDDKIAALLANQGLGSELPHTSTTKPAGAAKKTKPAAPNGKKVSKKKAVAKKPQAPSKTYEKSLQFAHTYVRNQCNAAGAYKEIHPDCTDASAATLGWKMLRRVEVQKILFPLLEALMEKNEIDTEFVIGRMLEQANASPLDYFHITEHGTISGLDLTGITEAQRRNLRSVQISDTKYGQTVKVTVVDQQKATEMFAKYLQMFTKEMEQEDLDRIGDLLEAGITRIRKYKNLDAWKEVVIEGQFSDVG